MHSTDLILYVSVAFASTAIFSYFACWLARQWAPKFGLIDRPGGRKAHGKAIPLGGGLAMAAAVLSIFGFGMLALWLGETSPQIAWMIPEFAKPHLDGVWSQGTKLWILLGGASALAVLGCWDDARGLDWRFRLGVQLAGAGICVVLIPNLRLTAFITMPVWTTALSVFWLVALVNAFNMLDNMDGLSSGVGVLCGSFLAAILLLGPNPESASPQLFVAGLTLVVVGAAFGFWCHNWPPAKLFMGDAGSYFLGFLLAAAALLASYTSYNGERKHAILAPLFVMAVPLYDMATVIAVRLANGQSPFAGDRNHFSHRLVELGFSRPRAVLVIYLVTTISGLAAFLLHRVDLLGGVILIALMLCQFALVALIELTARRTIRK